MAAKKPIKTKSSKTQASNNTPRYNGLKWLIVLVLLAVGIVANYYFISTAWAIRAACGIVLVCILLAILYQTSQGRKAWGFVLSAKAELRKVVWPDRQTTIRMSLMIIGLVILLALILWAIDSGLMLGITSLMH